MSCTHKIFISEKAFDIAQLNSNLQSNQGESGATVIFTGNVRVSAAERGLTGMTLEHYPGMTESLLEEIITQAISRWSLSRVIVAHRVGYLSPGEPIVFVGSCALHRKEAFESVEFIMDYLKNRATFWKKEHYGTGKKARHHWVDAKTSDISSLEKWRK